MLLETEKRLTEADLPVGPTVSTSWLADHLAVSNLRVLDVRGEVGGDPPAKRADYEVSHIPGAVFVDWTNDFVDVEESVPITLASAEVFSATAARLGVGNDHVVVVYDDYFHIFAGRVWWALRSYGHTAVRVLDGGWKAWMDEGRPISGETPMIPPASFTPEPDPSLRCSTRDVEIALSQGAPVVDARPRHLYEGSPDAPRTGHIPGAINIPYPELIDERTGRLIPAEELAAAFSDAGIDVTAQPLPIVSSCGSGVSATVVCMALELLGQPSVPVYDGSFSEWAADPKRPIAQGCTP